jgi:hypothetical protein
MVEQYISHARVGTRNEPLDEHLEDTGGVSSVVAVVQAPRTSPNVRPSSDGSSARRYWRVPYGGRGTALSSTGESTCLPIPVLVILTRSCLMRPLTGADDPRNDTVLTLPVSGSYNILTANASRRRNITYAESKMSPSDVSISNELNPNCPRFFSERASYADVTKDR